MSTKPTTVPLFDTTLTNASAPVAGLISNGYAVDAVPSSPNINYLFSWLGAWAQYLSDGDINAQLVTAATAKSIANATTNDWDPGSGSLAGLGLISITGGGASAKITGLQGTSIDGKWIILRNDTGSVVQLTCQDTGSAAAHRFVFNDAAAGSLVKVPLNGSIIFVYNATTTRWVCMAASFDLGLPAARVQSIDMSRSTNVAWVPNVGYQTTGAGAFDYISEELDIVAGQRITGIKVLLNAAPNPTTVALKHSNVGSGVTTVLTYTVTGGTDSTLHTVTSPVASTGFDQWWIEVSGTAGAAAAVQLYSIVIEYDGSNASIGQN